MLNERYHLLTFLLSKNGKSGGAVSIKDYESGIKTYLTAQEIPLFVEETFKLKTVQLRNLFDYEIVLLNEDLNRPRKTY